MHSTPSRCTILQLPLNFKLFSYLTHMRDIRGLLWLLVRLDFIVNWHVYIQISLEVSLSLKILVYWRVFSKDLFENERRKVKFGSINRLGQ